MRLNHLVKFILMAFALIIPELLWSASKISECNNRPDFLNSIRGSAMRNLEALPQMVFVGRRADHYVEDKTQNLKIWSQQSFTRAESKVLCASAALSKSEKLSKGFSIYAPTLIDLSGDKKIGDSYWQFHLVAEAEKIGVWNQKSRVFSKIKDLEEGLQKTGAKYQFFQLSHDEYELILLKETSTSIEALSIRFDAVRDIK